MDSQFSIPPSPAMKTSLLGQDISSVTSRELDPELQLRRECPRWAQAYRTLYIMLYCICPSILGVVDWVSLAPSVKTHLHTITNSGLQRDQHKILLTVTRITISFYNNSLCAYEYKWQEWMSDKTEPSLKNKLFYQSIINLKKISQEAFSNINTSLTPDMDLQKNHSYLYMSAVRTHIYSTGQSKYLSHEAAHSSWT